MLPILILVSAAGTAAGDEPRKASLPPPGTIAFSSLAPRGWDLYVADLQSGQSRRLTDHAALDYNAAFTPDGRRVAFVSERDGNMELYCVGLDGSGPTRLTSEFALDDHPTWSPDGKRLAFVSTRQPHNDAGRAWNAVYVMQADGADVQRLTPPNASDYSPAWSPNGDLIAFATGSGKAGGSDLGVMNPDGSGRRELIKDGGWPTFAADGQSVFFHSRRDGQWGVWKVQLDGSGLERVTPKEIEAFTPRACADGKVLVLAVKRGGRRQIEVLDLEMGKLGAVTKDNVDHWNPAISPDGRHVVYHRAAEGGATPNIELWGVPPGSDLVMLRLAGAFPAFSPDGKRLALTGGSFASVDVMNVDGSDRKTIYTGGKARNVFGIYWAHHGDWISFAQGGVFQAPGAAVDTSLIHPDGSGHHAITKEAGNNGFAAFSPDGKQIVFRSGRGGSKNLYVMDRDGGNLRQLTRGEWTDTMCDWSPTGEWIAFASDRDGNFDIWLVKPNGSELRKLIGGSRNNHPHFSPDGSWIVFTSQRAGFSAEEISLPNQPQPYGDLFAVRLDARGLVRLTHNGSEEGTPAWGPVIAIKPAANGQSKTASDY
jgi:Tol biopolymer transport system component